MRIRSKGPLVTLSECPIGLFFPKHAAPNGGLSDLCLKTEYANNVGRIDAYIVSSGERFWGDNPQTIASQRATVVQPVEVSSDCESVSHSDLQKQINELNAWRAEDQQRLFHYERVIADLLKERQNPRGQ